MEVSVFLHLGSFLVLAPRRRHPPSPPPAEPSRQPSLSACPHPGGSCPFKRHPLPSTVAGLGLEEEAPPPGSATCAAAAAARPGLASGEAPHPPPGPGSRAERRGSRVLPWDPGSDLPCAGCPCSLPRTASSPVPPLSSAPGIRSLLTPLRHPLPGTTPIPVPDLPSPAPPSPESSPAVWVSPPLLWN